MAAPDANTFDQTLPTRPGTNDFNGIAKVDDAAEPPDCQTMPNAAEWNTIEYILLALARVMHVAIFSVTGHASPVVASFMSARSTVTTGTFTVTHNGTGDVSITWPANTYPQSTASPVPALNEGPGMIHAVNITNGVRVYTYNAAGSAADLNFTVAVN